ncbi:hypothetical protein B0H21DRAFT_763240 [Amylocystis lapponica]|nr:hypothetical protein B0H21DRAFT_763240 [Amylocystis lapponica]
MDLIFRLCGRNEDTVARLASVLEDDRTVQILLQQFFYAQGQNRLSGLLATLPQISYFLPSLHNATDFVQLEINMPSFSGEAGRSTDSSTSNQVYARDPIEPTQLRGIVQIQPLAEFRRAMSLLDRVRGRIFHQNPQTVQLWARVEGDTTTQCVLEVISPVIQVMNELLELSYNAEPVTPLWNRRRVGLSSQARSPSVLHGSVVDHVLILHGTQEEREMQQLPPYGPGVPLVIFEEKIIGCLRGAWQLYIDDYTHARSRSNHPYYPIRTRHLELSKILPQIRKYVFDRGIVYTMMSDSRDFAGVIWDRCHGWQSGLRSSLCASYGSQAHERERPHGCKVLLSNAGLLDRNAQMAPRELLAFFCWMALRDKRLL